MKYLEASKVKPNTQWKLFYMNYMKKNEMLKQQKMDESKKRMDQKQQKVQMDMMKKPSEQMNVQQEQIDQSKRQINRQQMGSENELQQKQFLQKKKEMERKQNEMRKPNHGMIETSFSNEVSPQTSQQYNQINQQNTNSVNINIANQQLQMNQMQMNQQMMNSNINQNMIMSTNQMNAFDPQAAQRIKNIPLHIQQTQMNLSSKITPQQQRMLQQNQTTQQIDIDDLSEMLDEGENLIRELESRLISCRKIQISNVNDFQNYVHKMVENTIHCGDYFLPKFTQKLVVFDPNTSKYSFSYVSDH